MLASCLKANIDIGATGHADTLLLDRLSAMIYETANS